MNTGDYPEGKITKTVGWKQACKCPPLEPIPCTVLDTFAGSGTTIKVARELGRWAIGIDISEEYKKLAAKRANLGTTDIVRDYPEK